MRRTSSPRSPRAQRHAARLRCQVVRERDFSLIADEIVNVSESGMLVQPSDPTLTGESVIVSFRTPNDGPWVDAEARVARVVHGRRKGEHTRCLGLCFEEMDAMSRRALKQLLLASPAAPPRARPGRRDTTDIVARLIRSCAQRAVRYAPI